MYILRNKIKERNREITTQAKIAFDKLPMVAMVPYLPCQ